MKKISVLLLIVSLALTSITKAQKSGILKKDLYGSFTGDDYESFLQGKDAKKFEAKSNISLSKYNEMVEAFAKNTLQETSTASAVANSTVKSFPAGADVYTSQSDGSWITRKTYDGESGYYHNPSGTYWLSFQCGNLCNVKTGKPAVVQPGADVAKQQQPATNTGVTNNIYAAQGNQFQSLGYREGMGVFTEGAAFYAQVQQNTVQLLKQNPLGCCGGNTSQPAMTAQPSMYSQAMPATYLQTVVAAPAKVPFGQSFVGNMLATAGGVTLGGLLEDAIQGNNRTVRYSGYGYGGYYSSNPTVVTNFQGSNQLGFTTTGSGGLMTTTGGLYPNNW